ncbi:MAG: nickel-type superoxide dismutase maturation protease [Cyanobacteria bacterium REEB459]|nr:nickel-type superoxide dismutase maturation protease [Cyanobacteria bacterium REEB459]
MFPVSPPQQLRLSQGLDLILWLLARRRRLRVVGESMMPLLQPGEEVLVDPNSYRRHPPQPGDLVVASHPHQPGLELIKWVVYGQGDLYFIAGINLGASTDSRSFGLVSRAHLLGRVVCRFP